MNSGMQKHFFSREQTEAEVGGGKWGVGEGERGGDRG